MAQCLVVLYPNLVYRFNLGYKVKASLAGGKSFFLATLYETSQGTSNYTLTINIQVLGKKNHLNPSLLTFVAIVASAAVPRFVGNRRSIHSPQVAGCACLNGFIHSIGIAGD
jgi:hypothetical protein